MAFPERPLAGPDSCNKSFRCLKQKQTCHTSSWAQRCAEPYGGVKAGVRVRFSGLVREWSNPARGEVGVMRTYPRCQSRHLLYCFYPLRMYYTPFCSTSCILKHLRAPCRVKGLIWDEVREVDSRFAARWEIKPCHHLLLCWSSTPSITATAGPRLPKTEAKHMPDCRDSLTTPLWYAAHV